MKDEGPLFRLCHDQQALRAVTVGVLWPRALLPAPGPHLLQPLLGLQDVPLHLVSVGLHAGDEQGQLLGGSPVGWGGQRRRTRFSYSLRAVPPTRWGPLPPPSHAPCSQAHCLGENGPRLGELWSLGERL